MPDIASASVFLKEPPGKSFSECLKPSTMIFYRSLCKSSRGMTRADIGQRPGEQTPAPSTASLKWPFLRTLSGMPLAQKPDPRCGRLVSGGLDSSSDAKPTFCPSRARSRHPKISNWQPRQRHHSRVGRCPSSPRPPWLWKPRPSRRACSRQAMGLLRPTPGSMATNGHWSG